MTAKQFLIPLKRETAKRVKEYGLYKLETYDEIINRAIDALEQTHIELNKIIFFLDNNEVIDYRGFKDKLENIKFNIKNVKKK